MYEGDAKNNTMFLTKLDLLPPTRYMLAAMTAPGPAWRLQVGLSISRRCRRWVLCAGKWWIDQYETDQRRDLKETVHIFSKPRFTERQIELRITRVFWDTFPTKRFPRWGGEIQATGEGEGGKRVRVYGQASLSL